MKSPGKAELTQVSAPTRSAEQDRAYLEFWFALAQRRWMSVVLVPGHPGGSAVEAAQALADIGQKVSGLPVRAITMSTLDYGTAAVLSDLQEQLRRLAGEASGATRAIEVVADEVPPVLEEEPKPAPAEPSSGLVAVAPAARFVIAVPCVISEPLGLAAAQGADLVVVLVELGTTRQADVRRIMSQVGRERVAGCLVVA